MHQSSWREGPGTVVPVLEALTNQSVSVWPQIKTINSGVTQPGNLQLLKARGPESSIPSELTMYFRPYFMVYFCNVPLAHLHFITYRIPELSSRTRKRNKPEADLHLLSWKRYVPCECQIQQLSTPLPQGPRELPMPLPQGPGKLLTLLTQGPRELPTLLTQGPGEQLTCHT